MSINSYWTSQLYRMNMGGGRNTLKLLYGPVGVLTQSTNTNFGDNVTPGNTRVGILIQTTSKLTGRTISRMGFLVRNAQGTPTGTFSYTVRDNADTLLATLATFSCTLLPANNTYVLPMADVGPYTLPNGQNCRVMVEYTGGNSSNFMSQGATATNIFDNGNTKSTRFTSPSYTDAGTVCRCALLYGP